MSQVFDDALEALGSVGYTVGDLVHVLWHEYQAFGWTDEVDGTVATRRAAAVLIHANSSVSRDHVQNAMRTAHDLTVQLGFGELDYTTLAERLLMRVTGMDAENACARISRSMFALVEFAQGGDINRSAANVIAFAEGGKMPPERFFQVLDNWGRYLVGATAQAMAPALVLADELDALGAQLEAMVWPS